MTEEAAEKRATDRRARAEAREEKAASVAGTKYGDLSEEKIREKTENTHVMMFSPSLCRVVERMKFYFKPCRR